EHFRPQTGGTAPPAFAVPPPGPLSDPSCRANQVGEVVIRAGENGVRHLASSARQSILENRRGSPVDKPASVLLPHPIQRAETRLVKLTPRAGEPCRIIRFRSVLNRALLLEEPRELVDVVEPKRLRQFLSRSGIECGSCLHQVARYQQSNFPAWQRSQ